MFKDVLDIYLEKNPMRAIETPKTAVYMIHLKRLNLYVSQDKYDSRPCFSKLEANKMIEASGIQQKLDTI